VDGGDMLKVFTDSAPIAVAVILPRSPEIFLAANSNAVLRLVSVANGVVAQKLKVEAEFRALKFDDTGRFCCAGATNGFVHVFEHVAEASSNVLNFKFKTRVGSGSISCIAFAPASHDQPSRFLVSSTDSSATILDCAYAAEALASLSVRQHLHVPHSLLPLKCCYSPAGHGYMISGSENEDIHIFSLANASNDKVQYLKHHQVPVVAVAVNLQDTILASADSLGRVVIWRHVEFSQSLEH